VSTDEPRYLIYSLTKTFIAVLFCRLADRGELSLDSPVTAWLDEPRLQEPTLRELLNHTAGVPDYADSGYAEAMRRRPLEPWPDEKLLLHALRRDPPPPWMYSNTGYLLLRRVLDTLVPGGFAGALERELTVPLGMTETTLALDPGDLDELAPGLSSQIGAATQDVRGRYHPCWVGHRTAISTAADLRRFWTALAAGELLGRSFHDLLSTVEVGVEAYGLVRPSYGLGVMADPDWPHGVLIGHGGGGPGYGAAVFALVQPVPLVSVVLKGEDGDGSAEAEAVAALETQVRESPA